LANSGTESDRLSGPNRWLLLCLWGRGACVADVFFVRLAVRGRGAGASAVPALPLWRPPRATVSGSVPAAGSCGPGSRPRDGLGPDHQHDRAARPAPGRQRRSPAQRRGGQIRAEQVNPRRGMGSLTRPTPTSTPPGTFSGQGLPFRKSKRNLRSCSFSERRSPPSRSSARNGSPPVSPSNSANTTRAPP
jgi:hypothetical protein